jgi:5'-nucleotidase
MCHNFKERGMPVSLDGQLVVAISSRALFDFEEENKVFEQSDDRAYTEASVRALRSARKTRVWRFLWLQKLLAFNDAHTQRVEVVILSRNDPVSGMRVFSIGAALRFARSNAAVLRGVNRLGVILKPLNANLFLSTHLSDVRAALDAGVPAAQVYPNSGACIRGAPARSSNCL